MEERIMSTSTTSTLTITVANQPNISGTIPLPLSTSGTNYYTTPLGSFAITEGPGFTHSGSGNSLNMAGPISISGVGDNYGTVSFTGNYVVNGGKGSGNVSWTGTHAPKIQAGTDTWTSDTTTPKPKPHPRHAKAKGQTS